MKLYPFDDEFAIVQIGQISYYVTPEGLTLIDNRKRTPSYIPTDIDDFMNTYPILFDIIIHSIYPTEEELNGQ